MRVVRELWRRVRGWWLLTAAAAVTAVLSWVGQAYTGVVAAVAVAVGGAVVAVVAERGRRELAERAKSEKGQRLYVSRVDRILDPVRVGVHPAAAAETADGRMNRTPPFVDRDRLPELRAALDAGGFVLVVGDSAAGKSRLAFEAMRTCLPRHVCVVPERADALAEAVATARLRRPAVLWLDDLERYLGVGGLTRADVAELLDAGQVVVLATMRAHERDDFSVRHDPDREQGDRQVARAGRDVLSIVNAEIRLERLWSPSELASAGEMVDDLRIAQALGGAGKYGLAELMAAGPQLLSELRDAWSALPRRGRTSGDARGAALVTAAVDVRLAGYHRPVPLAVLRNLHEAYLSARGGAALRPGSWENALAWATQPLHATSSLLESAEDEHYLAFDYLVDAAARDPASPPIPDTTWATVIDQAEPADAVEVAWQASFAGRTEHIVRAFDCALAAGQYVIAAEMAACLGDAGQERKAVELFEVTIDQAERSGTVSAEDLLVMRDNLAWQLGEKVGGQGDPVRALEIARRVAADSAALRGPAHLKTLRARLTLARQLGGAGARKDALALAREVGAHATDALGADHDIVLSARFEAAVWTRRVEGAEAAARQFGELLEDARSRHSVDLQFLIDCAWNLGGSLLEADDAHAALPALEAAINDAKLTYGEAHAHTLTIRLTHLNAVDATSGPAAAVELAKQLVEDSTRALGDDHVTTLEARCRVAGWTAEVGEVAAAVRMFEEIHADAVQALGGNHWLVEGVRAELIRLPGA